MKVLVTGGTGFIGRHVVRELDSRAHDVTLTTSRIAACDIALSENVRVCEYRLGNEAEFLGLIQDRFDSAVHLAWHGLPDYQNVSHIEHNVCSSYRLIRGLVEAGVGRIMVAGTCLEYGMHEGCLHEDIVTAPTTSYGISKDSLRKLLQQLQDEFEFNLIWTRLFYLYGPGQNPNSLIAALDRAIENEDSVFRMSRGDQLRDFLPVNQAATYLTDLLESETANGVFNCCSGRPTSVLSLVQKILADRRAELELDRGYYDYPNYEPKNFWGSCERMNAVIGQP